METAEEAKDEAEEKQFGYAAICVSLNKEGLLSCLLHFTFHVCVLGNTEERSLDLK